MHADDILLSVLISAIISFILIGATDTAGRAPTYYKIAATLTVMAAAIEWKVLQMRQ